MRSIGGVGLQDVQAIYSGPVGQLWELVMGQQVHIGGLESSVDLANTAEISAGTAGIDLCCCTGAGMRFLVRMRGAARMTGVDATEAVVTVGRRRCETEGLADRIRFVLSDVCQNELPDGAADFIWGEDAWCYVVDKAKLIAEAVRLVKPGGTIAFTDWVEGPTPLSQQESDRFLDFMKFPTLASMSDYVRLLEANGCEVIAARDTGRFAPCVDLYIEMLSKQHTYDALRIIGFDTGMMQSLAAEMQFTRELAHQGKVIQGLFVARRNR